VRINKVHIHCRTGFKPVGYLFANRKTQQA
jgi:hypothetical protein